MPKRRRRNNAEGQDSFLDILFNVIGILVLIVAFAALSSATTSQVQEVYLGVKGETQKQMLNIICAKNRCIQLDQDDQQLMERNFSIRIQGRAKLITPRAEAADWMSLEQITKGNSLDSYLDNKPAKVYNISMLIYQDSFQVAAAVETIGRKRNYQFRHVFFETGEPISIGISKAYVN